MLMSSSGSAGNWKERYKTLVNGSATEAFFADLSDTAVKDGTFMGSQLTSVNMPYVQSVGAMSFAYSSSLSTVSLPSCQHVGFGAFAYCTDLTSVSIPSCSEICMGAFSGARISSKYLGIPATKYIWSQGRGSGDAIFRRAGDGSGLIDSTNIEELDMPNLVDNSSGTTELYNIFYRASTLRIVRLNSLNKLSDVMFNIANKLEHVYIPKVTAFTNRCFGYMSGLTQMVTFHITDSTVAQIIAMNPKAHIGNTNATARAKIQFEGADGYAVYDANADDWVASGVSVANGGGISANA